MDKQYTVIHTGWGYIAAVWSDAGLWEMTFPQPDSATAAKLVANGAAAAEAGQWHDILAQELSLYFDGFTVAFSVPVDWRGYTAFQAAVLQRTALIPYGQVTSYGQVAREIGSPRAARAVGGALHINRTPVVVPCHRVVGSAGTLVGFGGGLELKKALLSLEQKNKE